jgi:hypothetical protein
MLMSTFESSTHYRCMLSTGRLPIYPQHQVMHGLTVSAKYLMCAPANHGIADSKLSAKTSLKP